MTALETALVPFHGHQLPTIKDGETIRVAMRPICEAIGLDWKAQYNRINRHPVLSTCVVMSTTQLPGETQSREVVTLPLDYLNGWLFGVDTSRVKPEIKDHLIEYQRECFAVLAAYWHQGVATNPRARVATIPQMFTAHRHINALIKTLKAETNPTFRRVLHGQLEQSCRLISLPCPALDEIGNDQANDSDSPLISEFWEVMDLLLDANDRQKINHARAPNLIAINIPQVMAAAHAAGLQIPSSSALRHVLKASLEPHFVSIKAVNSRHSSNTIKCWVFETPAIQPNQD